MISLSDPNPLSCMTLVNLESESLAERKSVVVASGPHEASVMRSVTRSPAFIQFESEDKLARVERVAGFRGNRIVPHGGYSRARLAFQSTTWRLIDLIPFVNSLKPNKSGTV